MFVQIIKGKDLSQKEARNILQIWSDTFGDGKIIDGNKNIIFKKEELFFIARDESNEMSSVGCLKSVDIEFSKKLYP
ncbi:MAG: hypothetical protein KAS71_18765, partial [Bacteroidales bacterium]|nr:hypothetical protein [Bacteroidales bacterium]